MGTLTPRLVLLLIIVSVILLGPSVAGELPTDDLVQEGNRLFQEKQWAAARNAYARVLRDLEEGDPFSPPGRTALRQIVACAQKLDEWDSAFTHVRHYAQRNRAMSDGLLGSRGIYYDTQRVPESRMVQGQRITDGLELRRQLLVDLGAWLDQSPALASAERRQKVRTEQVKADVELVKHLLEDGIGLENHWGFSSESWWSEQARTPEELETNRQQEQEDVQRGLRAGPDGQPKFLTVPNAYKPELGRGRKALFLLHEIERLDNSPNRDEAASAVLMRARIATVLYGPPNSPYQRYERWGQYEQATARERALLKQKPDWELADNEARAVVNYQPRVVTLPEAENPLALFRQVETRYPRSRAAAEAIYLRGSYYQSRQQFQQAIAAYEAFCKAYPKHPEAEKAQKHLKVLRRPMVCLDQTQIYLAGRPVKLRFWHRATERVEFVARPFALRRYLENAQDNAPSRKLHNLGTGRYASQGQFYLQDEDDHARITVPEEWQEYLGDRATTWTEQFTPADPVTLQTTTFPIKEVGAYFVEARVPGKETSYSIVLITDIGIVEKKREDGSVLYVCNPDTGAPLPGQEVKLFVHDDKGKRSDKVKADQNGLLSMTNSAKERHVFYWAQSPSGGLAFDAFDEHRSGLGRASADRWTFAVVTDRPVYRPGATVHFRLWVREHNGRSILPAKAGVSVPVRIRGPQARPVATLELKTDHNGGVTGSFPLSPEAALGDYDFEIDHDSWRTGYRQEFRVEEYKKPEFAVTITPAQTLAVPGRQVPVRITAHYLFGQPVAHAEVKYQIARSPHWPLPRSQPLDWLYSSEYGWPQSYPWLRDPQDQPQSWREWWAWNERQREEFVARGTVKLDAQGTAQILVDTHLPAEEAQECQRYVIEAEVRDESRRTVVAYGNLDVMRQQFLASLQLDRGWYAPGAEVEVKVLLRTLNDQGVPAKGELRLYRVTYPALPLYPVQTVVATLALQTDAEGKATVRFPIPEAGQYRFVCVSQDANQQEVTTDAVVWAYDPSLDGSRYRSRDLEIIPDKHTYKVGETARLLFRAEQPGARVLLCENPEAKQPTYRLLDLQRHFAVVEVKITPRHVPNHYVEATHVARGQVIVKSCELLVPPVRDLLQVEVTTDKPNYKPGEKGKIHITAKDGLGQPVPAEVTLTVFDKAVTHIAEESTDSPTLMQRMRLADNPHGEAYSSLERGFSPRGRIVRPQYAVSNNLGFGRGAHGYGLGGLGGGLGGGGLPAGYGGIGRRSGTPPVQEQVEDLLYRVNGTDPLHVRAGFATVRRNFRDTALWHPTVALGPDGKATVELTFPDSLTTWRLRAYAMTPTTQTGDGTGQVTTSKKLLVRLQTPRYLVEGDEVVLTANVHNHLETVQDVVADLHLDKLLFRVMDGEASARARVKAGATHRFDWRVQPLRAGPATILAQALTEAESDAMQVTIPILKRGKWLETFHNGVMRPQENTIQRFPFEVPAATRPDEKRLAVSVALGPVTAMLDTLPFLIDYPYGCTEQTMSRFYPAVLAADTLKKLGIKLEDIAQQGRAGSPVDKFPAYGFHDRPTMVLDSAILDKVTRDGLERLYKFQHEDGGWGWWENDESKPYMTAYVLLGLYTARQAGVKVDQEVLGRGAQYLYSLYRHEDETANIGKANPEGLHVHAYAAYVLTLVEPEIKKEEAEQTNERAQLRKQLLNGLYNERQRLTPYGSALLALALHAAKDARANSILAELRKQMVINPAAGTAWTTTAKQGWWRWWHNDIETNAMVLRAFQAIEPKSDVIPALVQTLLSRREGGRFWRSTRDTALVVAALAEHVKTNLGPMKGDRVTVRLDGKLLKEWTISRDKVLVQHDQLVLSGEQLPPGKHDLTIEKQGGGTLYLSASLRCWTRPDRILPEGHALNLQREYYRVLPDGKRETKPLAEGTPLNAGDMLEAKLTITADDEYDYLAITDPRPAGCEPAHLQSGSGRLGYQWINVEIRDTQTLLFVPRLDKGRHTFTYLLRTEVPGSFRVPAAEIFAMYAPEIRASSGEVQVRVNP